MQERKSGKPQLETFQQPPGCSEPVDIKIITDTKIVDNTGIPLDSDRSGPELTSGIDFQYGPNPYRDSPSRSPFGQPRPIPMSRLERDRLRDNYSAMAGIVGDVREEFLKVLHGGSSPAPGEALNSRAATELLSAFKHLPSYLVFRAQNPVAPKGEMPPALIALSNSASGSIGALWAYRQAHIIDAEKLAAPPDVDEVIFESERLNTMVGEKTVCAASPAMMKHFISSVAYGSETRPAKAELNIWEYIQPEELPALMEFSHSMTFCKEAFTVIGANDRGTAILMDQHLKRGHSDRRVRETLGHFLDNINPIFGGITIHQVRMNDFLGRAPKSPELSLTTYEAELNLLMPGIISRLTRAQVPQEYFSDRPKRVHLEIDPKHTVWRLLAENAGIEIPDP